MNIGYIVQPLPLFDHNQWKKKLSEDFLILGPTLELTYYVFFFHQISSRKE